MALTGHREHHPALLYYQITIVLILLTVLLGFICAFVPWAQVDAAPGTRIFAYPFKTCYVNTFSTVHEERCLDNDFIVGPLGAPLTGGNNTCKVYLLVTVGMFFVGVLGVAQLILPFLLVVQRLWSRPIFLATLLQAVLVTIPIECAAAFSVFIAYSETTCKASSIFPTHGYSYGFVQCVFCTALSLAATVTGFLGLKELKKYQILDIDEKEKDVYVEGEETTSDGPTSDGPTYPVAAPTPESHPVY